MDRLQETGNVEVGKGGIMEQPGALKLELEETFSSIPCGLCVYRIEDGRISPVFHNPAFYEILGYSEAQIKASRKQINYDGVHPDDLVLFRQSIERFLWKHEPLKYTYRMFNARKKEYRFIRLEGTATSSPDGTTLLYCVFNDVSEQVHLEEEFAQASERMEHLVNSIPGGIASYNVVGNRFIPTFFSEGVMALTGHTREEYMRMVEKNALDIIYEPDLERVLAAVKVALLSGEVLDISYRMRHKNGKLVWIHLNGRRMGPLSETTRFYAVFTGISEETRLFQSIANETADAIYIIDQENYDLLYANESKTVFIKSTDCVGQKCYEALRGNDKPCDFCPLKNHPADGKEYEMPVEGTDRLYRSRYLTSDWNGIPAYVQFVRDVTEEIKTRKEKIKLEQYFQNLVQNLPGGVAVVQVKKDGSMVPEYLSDGFAQMTGMTLEDAWKLYRKDAMDGVHPDDVAMVKEKMTAYRASGDIHCEIIYRLKKGDGSYLWVKNTLSLIQDEGEDSCVYAVYNDITKEREEQAKVRQQYENLIMQHYRDPEPNALIIGHCNITQNRILEIIDHTDSDLLDTFGSEREVFFTGLGSLVVSEEERRGFLDLYLNKPSLDAFDNNITELVQKCFIKLPKEKCGRYVKFKVKLVETPDSGDITGVLTVTDMTEQAISDRILHQLSVTNYDFVVDLDLERDYYKVLTNANSNPQMPLHGRHSQWVARMFNTTVDPKDRERYAMALDHNTIRQRLRDEGSYTFSYSILDQNDTIRIKNMTVFPIDLRLGRVCLARADVTDMLAAERQAKKDLEEALSLAKEASRAKSDFLSNMSHDIRTPMNAIMGMTTLAMSHLDDAGRIEDCLQKIASSSRHLLSLINDILDMSKIERDKISLNCTLISLPQLLKQLTDMIAPQAKENGLYFCVRPERITHAYFYGDVLRISQILINLLSNAVKFTAGGGQVIFRVEELDPVCKDAHVRYRFTVSDTGIGMSEDFLSCLFEPFARSNGTSRIEGTGLGLSIAKGLADLMGGTISVDSQPRHGSRFAVELEFELAQPDEIIRGRDAWEGELPQASRYLLRGRRFLIAEDNAINAEILCELLQMKGAETFVATDGAQVMDAFRNTEPGTYDAILMDIQMPEVNGYEATRMIRKMNRPDAETIPIVAMTANAFAEDVQAALDSGMDAHVAKPVDMDLLQGVLLRLLD